MDFKNYRGEEQELSSPPAETHFPLVILPKRCLTNAVTYSILKNLGVSIALRPPSEGGDILKGFWHRQYDYQQAGFDSLSPIPITDLIQVPSNACRKRPPCCTRRGDVVLRNAFPVIRCPPAWPIWRDEGRSRGHSPDHCPQYLIAYYATLSLVSFVVGLNPAYPQEEWPWSEKHSPPRSSPWRGPPAESGNNGKVPSRTGSSWSTASITQKERPRRTLPCRRRSIPFRPSSIPPDCAAPGFRGDDRPGGDSVHRRHQGVPKGAVLSHANIIAASFRPPPHSPS
jgi:hypothetical protein